MTERKPAELGFETWVERQIRRAREEGRFDDLPGAGKPVPDRGARHDPNWWVKQKLRAEGLSYLPPALALRKEAADARRQALEARTDDDARRLLEDINERIRDAIMTPPPGPPMTFGPIDVEAVIRERRRRRQVTRGPAEDRAG